MPKISAAIITFNEEINIKRCLCSLMEVVDEIVVVDSGSTDQTQKIALELGAKVVVNPFKGHIEQKNFAITQTKYDWIISLDADEALSEELKFSILSIKNDLSDTAYEFNRLTNYCGKWIKHSGWYPDKKLRIFHKSHGKWGGKNPHDQFILTSGKPHHLKGDLLHYSFYTVEDHKKQIEVSMDKHNRTQEEKDNFQMALDIDVYFSEDAEASWAKMKEAVKVSLFKPV